MITYVCFIILGGSNIYLWLRLQSLENKFKSDSKTLDFVVNFIQPSEELKPHEMKITISRNKVSINEIKQELRRVEELAMMALNHSSSIIRYSKEHPISKDAINTFIKEQGLLNNESTPKSD